jgi:hypothetical protein
VREERAGRRLPALFRESNMIEIITPGPWAKVLTLQKDAMADEVNVTPGVRLGSVSIARLLRMSDRYPHSTTVSAITPAEEIEYGADFYY